MFDFYLNIWSELPELSVPRANISVYIDKVGTFAYALCGVTGNIRTLSYSDTFEVLDLVDMSLGWARIDYHNRDNVDLKQNENRITPLTDDKLLIYGANENRQSSKCSVVFDLKTFVLTRIEADSIDEYKAKCLMGNDFNKLLI